MKFRTLQEENVSKIRASINGSATEMEDSNGAAMQDGYSVLQPKAIAVIYGEEDDADSMIASEVKKMESEGAVALEAPEKKDDEDF